MTSPAPVPGLTRTEPGAWVAVRDDAVPDAVERILATLPEWFGRPEVNAAYVETSRAAETWTVREPSGPGAGGPGAGEVVGLLLVERHFPHVAEVHLVAVERGHRGRGVGRALLGALEEDARVRGVRLLEVKTLGASYPDAGYARTRAFYEAAGFLPLEQTALWGEGTPCLIMVKPL